MKLVAVTACPTGIAHTYMAAEALEVAAAEAGHEIAVETQGSAGSTPLTDDQLAEADAVILAADVEVRNRARFAHLPVVEVGVRKAVGGAPALVEQAVEAAGASAGGEQDPADRTRSAPSVIGPGPATKLRGWLMTGVSYVIPFVAAGGLLKALGYAIGGRDVAAAPAIVAPGLAEVRFDPGALASWGALAFQIGSVSFTLLVPVLAGFVAYAIADRPALAPGVVGGAIAVQTQAGFLGGLVAGLLAGAVVRLLTLPRPPPSLARVMPVLLLPLIGTAVTGVVMFVLVGPPLATATALLTSGLSGLSDTNAVLLGALLGLMMAFDVGGPVNKAAYAFAVAGLSTTTSALAPMVMAAVMAAGMTPPLALALCTVVRRRLFSEAEREHGRAAWLMGASFITEGAIPFAAADPLRVIPSLMAGSAVAGALSMGAGATLPAPHGGIFVIWLVGHPVRFLLAVVAGTLVSAALVVALKSSARTAAPEVTSERRPTWPSAV
ncbi:PTS fructose transporter subunit IIC [Pseudonocardia phyllosphaerae]|uniref:PTS fructose transporter subunit IIC n=1 Tax=Pseudonocardia phyllosphaerae TaxID=3390502 RepID=UPI00397B806A